MLPRALLAKAPLFFLATTLSAANPVIVSMEPHVGQVRQDVRIQLRIWPDDRNRYISVGLTAEDGSVPYSTGYDLDGSHEATVRRPIWYHVDPGEYILEACLTRTDKHICVSGGTLNILGS